jgi:hypothetical protein
MTGIKVPAPYARAPKGLMVADVLEINAWVTTLPGPWVIDVTRRERV